MPPELHPVGGEGSRRGLEKAKSDHQKGHQHMPSTYDPRRICASYRQEATIFLCTLLLPVSLRKLNVSNSMKFPHFHSNFSKKIFLGLGAGRDQSRPVWTQPVVVTGPRMHRYMPPSTPRATPPQHLPRTSAGGFLGVKKNAIYAYP